jgi:(p)ppGpp synthase/HD superfamily hydrolase
VKFTTTTFGAPPTAECHHFVDGVCATCGEPFATLAIWGEKPYINGGGQMRIPTVAETIEFMKLAHGSQVDKAGEPFWLHPYSVMTRLGPDASSEARLVALLHDVIEDTDTTADELRARGYPREVVEAVELVTRPPADPRTAGMLASVTYLDWIRSIAVSGNALAIAVKIADCEDNANPDRKLPEAAKYLRRRYVRALRILRGEERSNP